MSKVDRNNPRRSTASESRYTFTEFDHDFPDDAACLDWLVNHLYPDGIFCPKCERVTKHHRVKSRPSYSCQFCGRHEHPMKGTIFEDSATSLKVWFHAIFLMAQTRGGISAKQIERETGVTYKTAWRMFHKIRALLGQDGGPQFDGTIEIDEAYIGGKDKWKSPGTRGLRGRATGRDAKTPVVGVARRKEKGRGGRIYAQVVDHVGERALVPHITTKVLPRSVVYTDDWRSYDRLGERGYRHSRIPHSQKVYVSGNVHTNTVEGFWSLLKRGIAGAYHGVSTKHLQSYIDEYVFRYNNREANENGGMFGAFLGRIGKAEGAAS